MDIRHLSRLYVEAGLGDEQAVTLNDKPSHYLQHVMRMKTGDALRVFNARDGEWLAKIAKTGKHTTDIECGKRLREPAAEPDLWLCCAPIKKAHFDYMIEKATELGTAVIQPLLTARTQIREVNSERCRAMAIEAAEQSERLGIPDIRKPLSPQALIKDWPNDRTLIICAEWGDAEPIEKTFAALHAKGMTKAAIVTGPEGGFAAEEMEVLKSVPGSVCVRLGSRILRADTAAIAALACWQAICGDWKSEAGG